MDVHLPPPPSFYPAFGLMSSSRSSIQSSRFEMLPAEHPLDRHERGPAWRASGLPQGEGWPPLRIPTSSVSDRSYYYLFTTVLQTYQRPSIRARCYRGLRPHFAGPACCCGLIRGLPQYSFGSGLPLGHSWKREWSNISIVLFFLVYMSLNLYCCEKRLQCWVFVGKNVETDKLNKH